MKKGGFLRNVLDTIRSNQASGQSGRGGCPGAQDRGTEFGGQLKPSHFSICQVAHHGFPEQPTAVAFDPVQKIAAIGTKTGALRIFGRPGVDIWTQHQPAFAVTHIKFIVNQGAIVTVTADDCVHLWTLRGPNLKLQLAASGQAISGSPQITCGSSPPPSQPSQISATAASPNSFLGQITDTVSGAVDSASDFLSGGPLTDQQSTPSPTGDTSQAKQFMFKKPEILQTLKFQRERITYIHLTILSKWLYIGTDRGNIHIANVETLELSGYSIAWNKAIELSRKTHPGTVIHISECPQDSNKLLIGYEGGCIVLWDLRQKAADGRYYHTDNLLWLAWHYEGKQFVAAHGDGSLITWQTRSNVKPSQIVQPHAKTVSSANNQTQIQDSNSPAQLAPTLARSFNNELCRPINKVEWKTSKSNEQVLLFSGGLPYDGFDKTLPQDQSSPNKSCHSEGLSPSTLLSSQQQHLKASSATPGLATSPSPLSPSISPNPQTSSQPTLKERSCFRSTSLTVMYGKSITVLEMDDTIIDFITICDDSPYENDTSDPSAVIVLLSNELISIDLTSSGYPSFDSPYPSASLNESPVTCVQYVADCSSDLIPFLYSHSQNIISRAPKKGFSDKEWPINGGEWGQSLQSYPELVITGHADGTIKFWDMSGVNFDLISKIKTSKLFERPTKLPNSIFVPTTLNTAAPNGQRRVANLIEQEHANPSISQIGTIVSDTMEEENRIALDETVFAIEKIEFYQDSKHLLVAGAFSQIIKFRLNKKEQQGSVELSTILIDPSVPSTPTTSIAAAPISSSEHIKQHLPLRVRENQATSSSSSGGSSSSAKSHRNRSNGFQPELVCLTPLLVGRSPSNDPVKVTAPNSSISPSDLYYCYIPPKITSIALQTTHNILAYAHETGVVLVDIIQKCVIMNSSLSDLYGGTSLASHGRDLNIQPFATSSILQHHYKATSASSSLSNIGATSVGNFSSESTHRQSQVDADVDQRQAGFSNEEGCENDSATQSCHNKPVQGNGPEGAQLSTQAGKSFVDLLTKFIAPIQQVKLREDSSSNASSSEFDKLSCGSSRDHFHVNQSALNLYPPPMNVSTQISSSSFCNQLQESQTLNTGTNQNHQQSYAIDSINLSKSKSLTKEKEHQQYGSSKLSNYSKPTLEIMASLTSSPKGNHICLGI